MRRTRPAVVADAPALSAIDALTWTSAVSPAPYDPTRPFFREGQDPADTIVATEDDELLGYVHVGRIFDLPTHAHVLGVLGLAVAPAAQGRGVGRLLVEAACAEAVRRGASKVELRVLGPNTTARRLYAACGFVEEGVLRGEFVLDGAAVDDVLMAWWADGPPTP